MDTSDLQMTFQKKYDEFAADLKGTFPEIDLELACAAALKSPESINRYYKEVYGKHAKMTPEMVCPGIVLPGVAIEPSMWATVSVKSRQTIYEYISILDLCAAYEKGLGGNDKDWAEEIMNQWKGRLDQVDIKSLAEKFKDMFGGSGGMPQLPEKFLKGKLAKLAEDMVKEFNPEDFGLRPEDLAQLEKDPSRAFEILMKATSTNPAMLQTAMTRVGKKLQTKIQRGELKPEELAAEAEELMNEFQTHPAFAEMMKAFKSAFSFENPAAARASGREDQARLNLVRERLRAKLAAKNKKK
jgi:hypothetical protein